MDDEAELRGAPSTHGGFRRSHLIVLVAITLIGAALRLFRLGEWSFWVDEAHTFRDVTSPWAEFWGSNVSNYPLGYLVVRWLLDAGVLQTTGEGWLRLPFTFFGIVSVPAVAVFGRSVVGRRAALLAAAFLAVSPWHLYWSQNARAYAMTMFFALLAAFAAHRAARFRSIWLGVVGLVCSVLAGLAHPSGFLALGVLAVFLSTEVLADRELRGVLTRPWVGGLVVAVLVAAAVWVGPTVARAMEKKPNASVAHVVQTFAWYLEPPFVVAAIGGACVMLLRAPRREVLFLVSWVIAPLGALIVAGAAMGAVTAQYGLMVLPPVLLLGSRLIVELADAVTEQSRVARLLRYSLPFVLLATLASEGFLYFFKRDGDRPRWREAASFVLSDTSGPRTVYSTNEPSMSYYLDRGKFWGEPDPDTTVDGIADWDFAAAGGGAKWFEAVTRAARAAGRSLYFVITEPELQEWDQDGAFDRSLRRGALQLKRYPCWTGPKDMTVLVYRVVAAEVGGAPR